MRDALFTTKKSQLGVECNTVAMLSSFVSVELKQWMLCWWPKHSRHMLTFHGAVENNNCAHGLYHINRSTPHVSEWLWILPCFTILCLFFRPSLVNLWVELSQFLLRCMALRCEIFLNLQLDCNCGSRSWRSWCCNFVVETVLSTVTVSRTASAIWWLRMLRSRGIRWQRRGRRRGRRRRRMLNIWRSPRMSWTSRLTLHRRVFTWHLGLSRFLCLASTRCDAIFRYLLAMRFRQWFRGSYAD